MTNACYSKRYNDGLTSALEWSGIAYQGSTDTSKQSDDFALSHRAIA
jgi:hypothetical protein